MAAPFAEVMRVWLSSFKSQHARPEGSWPHDSLRSGSGAVMRCCRTGDVEHEAEHCHNPLS